MGEICGVSGPGCPQNVKCTHITWFFKLQGPYSRCGLPGLQQLQLVHELRLLLSLQRTYSLSRSHTYSQCCRRPWSHIQRTFGSTQHCNELQSMEASHAGGLASGTLSGSSETHYVSCRLHLPRCNKHAGAEVRSAPSESHTHAPSLHTSPVGHLVPHKPQFPVFASGLMHSPLHMSQPEAKDAQHGWEGERVSRDL